MVEVVMLAVLLFSALTDQQRRRPA